MGFLESLLKSGARKLANSAADAVISGVSKGISEAMGTSESTAKAQPVAKAAASSWEDKDVYEKLEEVLASEFSQYQVRREVSPTEMGGTGKFLPYSFVVYQNGDPKLFIMVVYNNTCCTRTYRWSQEFAQQKGVTMINFVYAFANKQDYMKNRLHQYL